MITGRSKIPIKNDLVRIAEPNSVDATIQIFRRSGCNRRPPVSGSGAAIRTKMSCSDGRATSNCVIRVRAIRLSSNRWGSPAPSHFLEVAHDR